MKGHFLKKIFLIKSLFKTKNLQIKLYIIHKNKVLLIMKILRNFNKILLCKIQSFSNK